MQTTTRKPHLGAAVFAGVLALFTIVFVRNAWVVDDAYITFRSVDNFLAGYGPVWNVGERVQVYSHPLWFFLVSLVAWPTHEVFYSSLALSYLLCLASFGVVARAAARMGEGQLWRGSLVVVCALASKAFVDYSSSGLENPLSYLLAALFVCTLLWRGPEPEAPPSADRLGGLFFVGALAFVNRQDTLLLYAPALLGLLWGSRDLGAARLLRVVLVATLPATLWLGFAIFYYGSPFPNTALAKAFGPGVAAPEKLARGVEYLANSLRWDLFPHLAVLVAVALAAARRSPRAALLAAGIAVYYVYVVSSAAAATHMSGRFFALPVWIAILVAVGLLPSARAGALAAAAAVFALLVNPHSPARMGSPWYADVIQDLDHIDTNLFVHREGAALVDAFERPRMPDHAWYHDGLAFRDRPEVVSVGAEGGAAIGYFGYAAGPGKIIIDYAALTDPLLARLPACNLVPPGSWRSGHFFRSLPPGYLASLESGQNRIEDPGLHEYYERVRLVTRAPLLSPGRFATIVGMNLGRYDELKRAYVESAAGSCRIPTRRPG
jgi:arabinofuranosyltransferase